jgi:hypothetical protein
MQFTEISASLNVVIRSLNAIAGVTSVSDISL